MLVEDSRENQDEDMLKKVTNIKLEELDQTRGQEDYLAVLRSGDVVKEERGNSPIDALLKIKAEKDYIKTVIIISKGDKRWEVNNRPLYYKRLLNSHVLQQIFNKQALTILQ